MSCDNYSTERVINDYRAGLYESWEDAYLSLVAEKQGRELTDSERQESLYLYAKLLTAIERRIEEEQLYPSDHVNPLSMFSSNDNRVLTSYMADKPNLRRDWWKPKVKE